ncbi:aromatic amino acid exporter YddG [Aliiroseovarius lamellibrachiae]|uniref:aromatic amino acid exporter YddG n=1 Tax=Aliiroseovarius lamellibrachiae TaxID=1924933 RepID=UPI001BE10CD4|nr:EamA family transporter [Aliiroseovarius lamellibrachiae]MBT2130288.1 EamA family transporter [Aliiroseovarius lamellibrachiae]
MTRSKATLVGFGAVLLWALLALFTVGSAPVPPFQLAAMCFAVGGTLGAVWIGVTTGFSVLREVSWRVYLFGTLGLFGYHALYFSALRMAPAAEAGLIAYLWPLMIVLFSGLLPGEHLRPLHVIGALISFAGAALIVLGGAAGFSAQALPGYGLALLCALTWSGYSVLSRRLGDTPTASVVIFCLATAVLALGAHLLFEDTVWPANGLGWLSILGLGLGPVGLAFYVWDIGVKRGDIQLLGVASYGAPLLSTLVLILAGIAAPSLSLLVAGVLITVGAVMAARAGN